jgi:hypothetical protein
MTSQYIYFIIFACIAYLIFTDESIAKAFYYILRIIKNKFVIFWWWLRNNPQTPWARYSMWKRSNQLAKELMNELESKNK